MTSPDQKTPTEKDLSMIKKFRKRPVEIEAVQLQEDNVVDVMEWCDECEPFLSSNERGIIIPTLEGKHLACWDDWIIKGIKGEFYPCKPDIFELTYEAINVR